jgi:hypothetical protein
MHSANPQVAEEKSRILNAIDATQTAFYLDLSETLSRLNRELAEFHNFLHEKLGETAPVLFQLREEIEKIRILVNKWLIERKGVDLKKQSEIKSEQQSERKQKQGNL